MNYYRAQRGWGGRKFEAYDDEEAWEKAKRMTAGYARRGVPLILHRAEGGQWKRVEKR
jgi:hypothetical protein